MYAWLLRRLAISLVIDLSSNTTLDQLETVTHMSAHPCTVKVPVKFWLSILPSIYTVM